MPGKSDENFERLTKKFFPTKNFPDILSPNQNFYLIFLSRPKLLPKILYLNQIVINPNFYTLNYKNSCFKRRIAQSFIELVNETNSFGHIILVG